MTDTPNRPPLPGGEAVLYAAAQAMGCPDGFLPYERELMAAALRAAADQVVPDDPDEAMHFTTEAIRLNRMSIRASLLAIAAELEGAKATGSTHLEVGDE